MKKIEKKEDIDKRSKNVRNNIRMMSLLTVILMTSGCGVDLPEIETQAEGMIAEYAVELLLYKDSKLKGRLVDTGEIEAERETIVSSEVSEDESTEKDVSIEEVEAKGQETSEIEEASDEELEIEEVDIANMLGIEGLQIQYITKERYNEYPELSIEETPVFSLGATPGNELLIFTFEFTNITSETIEIDMIELKARFRIKINGGQNKSVLTTMLINDMSTFRGEIEAGMTQEVVLVVEIKEGEKVDSATLTIKKGEMEKTVSLQTS